MMTLKKAKYWIELHVDFGEPIPQEVADYIQSDPEARQYFHAMTALASALHNLEINPHDDALADHVMAFIDQREEARTSSWFYSIQCVLLKPWQWTSEYIASYDFGFFFYKESWSLAFVALIVVWGAFITPQVEAGKADELHETIENKVITLTDEAFKKAEAVADQINDFASGLIHSVTDQQEPENPQEPKKSAGLKYSPYAYRNLKTEMKHAA